VLRTDSFEAVLFRVVPFRYTPALNINIVSFGQILPKAFPLNRRIRFALRPQGGCTLSTNCKVEMPLLRCSQGFYYGLRHTLGESIPFSRGVHDCRERVGNIQRDIEFPFSGGINIHAIRPQVLKKIRPVWFGRNNDDCIPAF
jgi:hypothetical protein